MKNDLKGLGFASRVFMPSVFMWNYYSTVTLFARLRG